MTEPKKLIIATPSSPELATLREIAANSKQTAQHVRELRNLIAALLVLGGLAAAFWYMSVR